MVRNSEEWAKCKEVVEAEKDRELEVDVVRSRYSPYYHALSVTPSYHPPSVGRHVAAERMRELEVDVPDA